MQGRDQYSASSNDLHSKLRVEDYLFLQYCRGTQLLKCQEPAIRFKCGELKHDCGAEA